jgi:hypothetical protein
MLRRSGLALAVAVILASAVGEARAQYWGWGWGGWGGGSTVQGDIARGLGFYSMGAGIYNQQTAIANSINADTVMRWNQYLWLSQQEANRREYIRRARRGQRDTQAGEILHQRLLNNPTAHDIDNGDALNVVLDQVTDPRVHTSALRLAKDPINSDVIDDIPFENASEAVTISLNQLSAKGVWPTALQGDNFAQEREEYQQAVANALKEDEEGQISGKALAAVQEAVRKIRVKYMMAPPADVKQKIEADNYVKTLSAMTRMLEKPSVEKVIAEVQKVKQTSLGSLLGFMHHYNLRFAPATTPEQRAVYEKLYPMMVALRDQIIKPSGNQATASTTPPPPKPGHPTDFFQGLHLEKLK